MQQIRGFRPHSNPLGDATRRPTPDAELPALSEGVVRPAGVKPENASMPCPEGSLVVRGGRSPDTVMTMLSCEVGANSPTRQLAGPRLEGWCSEAPDGSGQARGSLCSQGS